MVWLRKNFAAKGYEFGPADIYPPYTPNPLLVVLTMTGAIALFVYVVQMLIQCLNIHNWFAFFGISLVSIVVFIVTSGTFNHSNLGFI